MVQLSLFGILIFLFKNTLETLCLSKDKTKRSSSENTTLTPTKTLPKNRDTVLLVFKFLYPLIN